MFNYLVCCISVVFLVGSVTCDDCRPNKVIYNVVFDKQVAGMNNELLAFDKHYINMAKSKFTIKDGVVADGVKLYDITQLEPDNTYIWTEPDNVENAEINYGLHNMRLEIGTLEYDGERYSNATITATGVSLKTHQLTQYSRYSCTQKYTDFTLSPVKNAMLNGEKDVTSDFNTVVIPWVNRQMNTPQFTRLVGSYFDNCDAQSLDNLRKLITEPYSP